MAHLPINHPAGRFYRLLAGAAGAFLVAFGVTGLVRTAGMAVFGRGTTEALGLPTNPAFATLSLGVGLVVLLGAILGGNLAHYINFFGGIVFWVAGLAMLALMQTSANLLNYTVSAAVVSYLIGTVLFLAGLYGKVGTTRDAQLEETFRHSSRGALLPAVRHRFSFHPGIRHDPTTHG